MRFFVTAVAFATVGLSLSACDASPYAATANGQTIKALSLNTRLAEWGANKTYVNAQDAAAEQGTSGAVAITGAGSGTYTSAFVATTLSQMVVDSILRQHLTATGSLPDAAMLAAARGVYEANSSNAYWFGFPDKLRAALTDDLADEAAVVPASSNTTALQEGFSELGSYMWTQLCVTQSSAFNLADAKSIESAGVPNGTSVCWDQAGLEDQPAAYRTAVFALTLGQTSKPISTSYGYEVVKEVSRKSVPLDSDTAKVLTIVLDSNSGVALPSLDKLILGAKVKVNPAYGTWNAKRGNITPPTAKGS
jgi:hypothetical protein